MSILPIFAEVAVHTNSAWLNVVLGVLGVIGVIGIIGAASAYFYKGRADALISLQEKEIKVLQDNNKTLKEQNQQLKDERTELIIEIKRMRQEMKTLRGLITQPKQLQKLAATMAEQHAAVIDKLTDIAAGIVQSAGDENGSTTGTVNSK